jgi:hypothetical protein
MKIIPLLLPVFLLGICSYAQTGDSAVVTNSRPHVFGSPSTTTSLNVSHSSGWWQIVSRENVSFKTSKFQLSSIENKIMDLESAECGALRNRDTITLIKIWARDFTQDEKQNKVIESKDGLPNYLSLYRMAESITEIDSNTVYTSGYEVFREIKGTEKIEAERTRKYFHIWTRRSGLWKLTTKRFD